MVDVFYAGSLLRHQRLFFRALYAFFGKTLSNRMTGMHWKIKTILIESISHRKAK